MATTFTVQTPPHAGLSATMTAPATTGDVWPTGGGLVAVCVQTAATAASVSLPVPNTDGLAVTARSVAIPGVLGSTVLIPLPTAVYGPTISPTWTTPTTVVMAVISAGN